MFACICVLYLLVIEDFCLVCTLLLFAIQSDRFMTRARKNVAFAHDSVSVELIPVLH